MAGKAGSLLIDLAANVAQLRQDFNAAEQEVSNFAQSVVTIGTRIAGALGAMAIASKIQDFAKQVADTGVKAEELAQKLKLTAEQAQALQVVSNRTGQSLDELAKYGKQNSEWLERVTQNAKDAGQVIDNEYTAALKRMQVE